MTGFHFESSNTFMQPKYLFNVSCLQNSVKRKILFFQAMSVGMAQQFIQKVEFPMKKKRSIKKKLFQ